MPEMENPRPSAVCGLITLSYNLKGGLDGVEDPALRPGVEPCLLPIPEVAAALPA